MTPAGQSETVELVEEEFVVPGGTATVSWLVRWNDGWVRAPSHPAARCEPLERGSGTVWRTRVTLELPRGNPLTRIERRPGKAPKTAFEHLTGGGRGASRRTAQRSYLVGPGGRLVPKTDESGRR